MPESCCAGNSNVTTRVPSRYSEIGCRIPKDYLWVSARGERWGIETGPCDAALHMAGIESYNVMLHTSVLPPESVELRELLNIHHGSVLEGIIAIQHTDKPGTQITAGLLLAGVYLQAPSGIRHRLALPLFRSALPASMRESNRTKQGRPRIRQIVASALLIPSSWYTK